jgi:crossover junction endodeoxyribonuclease RusA
VSCTRIVLYVGGAGPLALTTNGKGMAPSTYSSGHYASISWLGVRIDEAGSSALIVGRHHLPKCGPPRRARPPATAPVRIEHCIGCSRLGACVWSLLSYMIPFEFIVPGPPVSHQAKNRVRLEEWRNAVRGAAQQVWPPEDVPVRETLRITVFYYHDGDNVRLDNDNMLKPIQDALIGLVYEDDRFITDVTVRKTNLNGNFQVRGLSPVLAAGFRLDAEFLYVRLEHAPDHGGLP